MSEENNKPATEHLDFHSGYKVHDSKLKPFPGQKTEEPRIFFESDVFQIIQKHASETVAVELCGILVGKTCQDNLGNYLVISSSIRGEHARHEGAQVVFTHETWDYIHSEMEEKHPDLVIVGWYHTHPGFGIFLSDMDKFIQDYFFNLPFQVALVLDPVNSNEGLFSWIKGETRSLPRCWIGDEVYKLTQGAVGSKKEQEKIIRALANSTPNDTATSLPTKEEATSDKTQLTNFLPILLAFFVGISFSSIMFRDTFFRAATIASRAETRELLGAWAADTSAAEEIYLLHSKVSKLSNAYTNLLTETNDFAQVGASFAIEINEVQARLSEMASATVNRRNRVHRALESVTTDTITRAENSKQVMTNLREAMAQSLIIQIMPYLSALSSNPTDINRIDDAKLIIQHIIQLDPRLEPELRKQIPWLF